MNVKKIIKLWNVFKALMKSDEYLVITAREHNPNGEERLCPIYYEYINNTNRKLFYLFAKDYINKVYDEAEYVEFKRSK